MSINEFLDQEYCDRCRGDLTVRTTSWFNTDTICAICSQWEEAIIDHRSESKAELEAYGSIPDVPFDISWGEEVPDSVNKEE